MPFTVAIVGRPNVGKSTLFNRLVGRREALVSPTPRMTRDLREGKARLGGQVFRVLDTAGHEEGPEGSLPERLRALTEDALSRANACLFVVDARAGLTGADRGLADMLRRAGMPIIVVANKTESRAADAGVLECWDLGLGDPVAVAAEHNIGFEDLAEALSVARRSSGKAEAADAEEAGEPVRIAVLGRPNVGKSTLVNGFLGESRLLTGPESGLTRDSISVTFRRIGRFWRVADTAGMRRHAGARDVQERLAVDDALRAIRFSEVVILVLDAEVAFEQQDRRLARLVEREGRALVLAANKWDKIRSKEARLRTLQELLAEQLPGFADVPLLPVSAQEGSGLDALLEAVTEQYQIWNMRVASGPLNRWLAGKVERHPPPAVRGRRIRLRYMAQTNTRPPTFALFSSTPGSLGAAYRRYLVNGLRRDFGFRGVPIRMMLRGSANPYAERRK